MFPVGNNQLKAEKESKRFGGNIRYMSLFFFFPLAMHLDFHHHCIVNSRIDDSQVTVDELAAELSTEGLIAPRNNPSRLVVSNMFYFP